MTDTTKCDFTGIHAMMWIDEDGDLHCLACEPPEHGQEQEVQQVIRWIDQDHAVDVRTGEEF
jgi:hypothetical protein